MKSLDALVQVEEFCPKDESVTLVQRIAALHVVFHKYKSQIMWFGQLSAHCPWILLDSENEEVSWDYSPTEMVCIVPLLMVDHESTLSLQVLHLCAVNRALDSLFRPLTSREELDKSLLRWLKEVHTYQNTIISIINLPSDSGLKEEAR